MKLNRKQFCGLFRADFIVVAVKFPEQLKDWEHPLQAGRATQSVGQKSTAEFYSYKAPLGLDVAVGDWVFVPESHSDITAPNLKRAQVFKVITDTDEFEESGVGFKWIAGTEKEMLAGYFKCLEQDVNLLKAVNKLEKAMDRVELQAQMKLAMELLSPAERTELTDSLGLDLSKLALLTGTSK